MFIVTVDSAGLKFYLKGTVWTSAFERAYMFNTEDEAKSAAIKAETFMHPRIRKAYRIEPAPSGAAQ